MTGAKSALLLANAVCAAGNLGGFIFGGDWYNLFIGLANAWIAIHLGGERDE